MELSVDSFYHESLKERECRVCVCVVPEETGAVVCVVVVFVCVLVCGVFIHGDSEARARRAW